MKTLGPSSAALQACRPQSDRLSPACAASGLCRPPTSDCLLLVVGRRARCQSLAQTTPPHFPVSSIPSLPLSQLPPLPLPCSSTLPAYPLLSRLASLLPAADSDWLWWPRAAGDSLLAWSTPHPPSFTPPFPLPTTPNISTLHHIIFFCPRPSGGGILSPAGPPPPLAAIDKRRHKPPPPTTTTTLGQWGADALAAWAAAGSPRGGLVSMNYGGALRGGILGDGLGGPT